MRRIVRRPLAPRLEGYLSRKQAEVDAGGNVGRLWKSARRTRTVGRIFDVLRSMAGRRERCMFCEDSRGTTIEHFWPKSTYPERTFVWPNWLLLCQGCQNHKGNRFELDLDGDPLLIDPTAEDPWDFLFFDSGTGYVTVRYSPATRAPFPKGEHTVDPRVLPLNIEVVAEGRLRVLRGLKRALREFEQSNRDESAEGELIRAVKDLDDYGLTEWFFFRDGADEPPFQEFRKRHPATWDRLRNEIHG